MKKILVCILAGLFSSVTAFSQSSEQFASILKSENVTYAQLAYLPAVQAQLISDDDSPEKAFEALSQNGYFSSTASANDEARLDEACLLYAKLLNLKGGLFYSLFHSKRYAFKELKAKNILPRESDPAMKISGRDSIDLFSSCLTLSGDE